MKNTFSKLRRTNKALINELEAANESLRLATKRIEDLNGIISLQENGSQEVSQMLKLATKEIDRLNKAIDIKDIFIGSLEIKEKELSDKIYSLYDKLEEQNKLNTDNYNAWLEEHETNRNLSIGLTFSSLLVFAFATAIVWTK